jgi:hypothetical protein
LSEKKIKEYKKCQFTALRQRMDSLKKKENVGGDFATHQLKNFDGENVSQRIFQWKCFNDSREFAYFGGSNRLLH